MMLSFLILSVASIGASETAADNANKAPAASAITEIHVERRGGPMPPRRDDVHLVRRNVPAVQFDRLARWLVKRGFFDLKKRYGGREPLDADGILITVVYGNRRKSVLNHAGAGDKETWEFEMIIRGVSADLARFKQPRRVTVKLHKAHISDSRARHLILTFKVIEGEGGPFSLSARNSPRTLREKELWQAISKFVRPLTGELKGELLLRLELDDRSQPNWDTWELARPISEKKARP